MNRRMLNMFWYWVRERHTIYQRRMKGFEWPWTHDPILQTYKFTNVFRELDAGTIALRKRTKGMSTQRIFWHTVVYRMFNWAPTYDLLLQNHLVDTWYPKVAISVLRQARSAGTKIFTGAYMITNAGKHGDKISMMCKSLVPLYENRALVFAVVKRHNSIQRAVEILREYPLIGNFVGYEIATDLRHTPILARARDINTWANAGPGAKRGIQRIWPGRTDYLVAMRWLLKHKQAPFKMELRDIEHSLCEFDKYARVNLDEGRPRARYRRPIE